MQKPTQERWLPIPGYEGLYEASDHGRVKSVERRVPFVNRWGQEITRRVPERIREAVVHPNGGHLYLTLHNRKRRQYFVHRLVMAAFVGPCPDGMEVCHNDGDPTNNRLENLRYGTSKDNAADQHRHGTNHRTNTTHCPKGHPYDDGNTYWRPDGRGRDCKACMKQRTRENGARYQRAYRARKKADQQN